MSTRSRRRPVRLTLCIAVALALAAGATGCAASSGPVSSDPVQNAPGSGASSGQSAPVPAGVRGRVVFDMGHGEIFGPDDPSELGQSKMVGAMRDAGFDVQVSQTPITPALLQGAAGIILAGPMRPLTAEEFQALDIYVREGGTVLLTVHVPFPVIAVPSHFGLPVTPVVIESDAPLPGADPSVFVADGAKPDPVTQGVQQLLVVSGWQVSAGSKQASIVIDSGQGTWGDKNRDGQKDVEGPFGVVGVARYGKGTVIVLGDDAILANVAIDEADNRQLLENLFKLFETSAKTV